MRFKTRAICTAISATLASTSLFSIDVFAQSQGLEEVIVTARKTEENIQEIPVAITSMSADDMVKKGVLNVKDINQTTPSMNITQAAGNPVSPRVALRGQVQNDTVFTLDPSVGIYLDEIYVGRAPGAMMDFYDIARVEVLKGPQGTLYGRNTTGGAMKIITNKADVGGPVSGYVKAGAGNYNGKLVEGAVNVPLVDDRLALRVAGVINKRDGYAENTIVDPVSGAFVKKVDTGDKNTQSSRFDLIFNATDALTFELQGDYSDIDTHSLLGYNKRGDVPAAAQSSVTTSIPSMLGYNTYVRSSNDKLKGTTNVEPRANNITWGTAFTTSYVINDNLTAKLVYGHREMDGGYDFDVDGTSLGIVNTAQRQGADQDTVELQLSGDYDALEWVTGLYWYDETGYEKSGQTTFNTAALNGTAIFSIPYAGDGENKSKSIYGQATWHFTDTLSFTAGLRDTWDSKEFGLDYNKTFTANGVGTYDAGVCNFTQGAAGITRDDATGVCTSEQSKNYKHISWTAGVDWQVLDDVMVYLKSSNGYRAGGQNLRGSFAATLIPFGPETVTDVEAGVKSTTFDNRLRANLAVYRSYYKDIQSTVFVTNPNNTTSTSTQVVNLTNAEINGAELELTLQALDALVLNGTASYTDTQYDALTGSDASSYPAGLQTTYSPRWKYSFGGTYTQPLAIGELAFNVNYSWRDGYWSNPSKSVNQTPTARTDAIGLVNARITLDIDSINTTVGLWGTNLADKRYVQNSLAFNVNTPYYFVNTNPQEPRMFGLDVTKKF